MHKPPPSGWPQITSSVFYREPAQAIAWLCDAFGFEVRLRVDGEAGEIVYCELAYGSGLVSIGASARPDDPHGGREFKNRHASPLDVDGRMTQSLCMFVDDADAHCAHARSRGAAIHSEPATHDYGDDYWSDRSYGAYDCEGHSWWFMTRVREQPAGSAGH